MALTNFRNNVQKPTDDDEYARLFCSIAGCGQRWSVKIDKPMCSFHQWGTSAKPKSDIHTALKHKPVKPWTEVDKF